MTVGAVKAPGLDVIFGQVSETDVAMVCLKSGFAEGVSESVEFGVCGGGGFARGGLDGLEGFCVRGNFTSKKLGMIASLTLLASSGKVEE